METRVTYTAAASSMDSWDMENLKYLKKISTNNPQGRDNTTNSRRPSVDRDRSGTYISSNSSNSEVDEEIFLRDAGTTEVELPNSTILHHTQKTLPYKNPPRVEIDEEINNNDISLVAPLDTCYLLDVVTIRNESVLAVRHPKPKLGSDGASSAGSSIGEANFFDDVNESLPEFGKLSGRLTSRAQSRSSTNSTLIENDSRRNGFKTPCPYCDNGMVTNNNNEFFYLGQKGNFEETSMVPTLGGEGPPEMPRTPSPYYVRLRRDLISYTPALRQPRNFGMDKQGQLLIDYSPNWAGLENYVRNLKRC